MKTIVAFHTGRGGRFYNAGFRKFIGTKSISDLTSDLYLMYENQPSIYNKIRGRKNLEALYFEATCDLSNDLNDSAIKFEKRTGLEFGKLIWVHNETPVGLSYEENEVGTIDIDGKYNTTSCMYLEDCLIDELLLIARSNEWNKEYLLKEYFDGYDFSDFDGDWEGFIYNKL